MIADTCASAAPSPLELLLAACHKGDAAQCQEPLLLLHKGAISVDAVGADGDTPLIAACKRGHYALATTLLALGASADALNASGSSALHFAARRGHLDALRVLLDAHASVDRANGNGATPLHFAARVGSMDVVAALLLHDAGVNAVEVRGWTLFILQLRAATATSWLSCWRTRRAWILPR